ncbi:hypothetical protein M9Y10_005383 [Tritrichomonas musculus]|uniref:Tryptophan synthase beta chain-like PALP domain-containing protein n=1 Tax=Tritrichomonas musculus TaxID=1915356 RepID=A0ABR2JM80_9EUKA
MTDLESLPVKWKDIEKACENLKDNAVITPCRRFTGLSDQCQCDLYLKLECFQRCKSFKFRGAFNKITMVPKGSTIICCSAGNHSQGCALSSTINGCKSIIYMPENAPVAKVQATEHYGGHVIQKGATFDDAKAEMQKDLDAHPEYIYIPPFDDVDIIAGQGTIGKEIVDQLPDVNYVVVPVGGGGLAAGVAVAIKNMKPNTKIIAVQMASCPYAYLLYNKHRKHEKKVIVHSVKTPLADGIAVKEPGKINLEILYKIVDDFVIVTEDEVAVSVAMLAERGKLITEGAGATSFAAVYFKKFEYFSTDKVCCIISGGNIPLQMLARCIERALFIRKSRVVLDVILPYGSSHMSQMLKVFVDNHVNVVSCRTVSHVDTVANQDHYNVVVDLHDANELKNIMNEFNEHNWTYSVESTTPVE